MMTLHPGKDDGFTILKSLIFIIPLLLTMSLSLYMYVQIMQYSSSLIEKGESIINEENAWVEEQLEL